MSITLESIEAAVDNIETEMPQANPDFIDQPATAPDPSATVAEQVVTAEAQLAEADRLEEAVSGPTEELTDTAQDLAYVAIESLMQRAGVRRSERAVSLESLSHSAGFRSNALKSLGAVKAHVKGRLIDLRAKAAKAN